MSVQAAAAGSAGPSWDLTDAGAGRGTLALSGAWTIGHAENLFYRVEDAGGQKFGELQLDGAALEALDTTGALLLLRLVRALGAETVRVSRSGFHPEHEQLFRLVEERAILDAPPPPPNYGVLARIGRYITNLWNDNYALLEFLGRTFTEAGRAFLHPSKLRVRELFVQLERVCVDALGIVALVMMLIGVVIAYLFAMQLVKYGAHIFLVDGVALAITRELSPIVVAIIMAGRSGSAFTAQIGTMKMNEEIDAMVTMGLSPMQVLVLPRTLALILTLPLLTFFGDIIGLAGGMVIAHTYAGISGRIFVERIYDNFPIESFYIGLVKAPVFALFIATIGCLMGLTVEDNAQSVGLHTTATVVRSIVIIIILNAAFAVMFAEIGFIKV